LDFESFLGTEKLVINNKSLTLILNTFVKREDKPDFHVKTRLKDTRFSTLFLKFHANMLLVRNDESQGMERACVLVKGTGQTEVQSEWVGTTWFRGLVVKDSCFEKTIKPFRYLILIIKSTYQGLYVVQRFRENAILSVVFTVFLR
jgi:hypothetical protein